MAIIKAECTIMAVPSMTANASKRTLLARQYLQGAAAFAKLSAAPQSQTSNPLEVAYVAGAIFLSVAALEAAINAVLIDDPAWKNIDKLCLLDKCDHALARCNTGKKLARGNKVCQRVDALIKLRNELVHYKPEWDDRLDARKQLQRKFQSVIPPRLLPKDFPKGFMTCDFAAKAVEWCRDFAKDFFSRMNMPKAWTIGDI